ncbi:ATP-binding protein [Egibacter rhizosphaerae]|uniref:ATP-binding protein n=1 Tax=Egibacter rhizosphaerae TaxID=1670831 RepID=A0A411YGC8_9ACTN|nr:IS21-like element helper ATPase IstB [Egibacter rhizosphaerae]QBI20236.1 ATP-binding protein [Egibacter rhizosphaerae]
MSTPTSTSTSEQLAGEVDALARQLRLPHLRKAAADVLPTAKAQRWDPAEVVRVLLDEEAQGRAAATIRNRHHRAGFPAGKTFDSWHEHASTIPTATQQALRGLEWLDRGENLAVVGPSGTGKSHLLEALGHTAIDAGRTVAWFTIEGLGRLVAGHRADDTVTKAINRAIKADLVVIDDIGLLPVPTEAAEALFRVIDAAYERRSIAISSNVHPGGFDELLPATIATAAVDRFMHHAHIVMTEGDSYRFAQARDGKGLTPLT